MGNHASSFFKSKEEEGPKVQEEKPKEDLHELFSPLTDEEEDEVLYGFSGGERQELLVTHKASNIEITREVLQCLTSGAWLNDEVINLYLELLKERERREPEKFLKCHFFNTFFYKRDGDRFWRMPECYIRGNTIKYLRVPDEVIDKVQEETKSRADRKPPGVGRGRGRGREDGGGRPAKGIGRGQEDGNKGMGGRGRGGAGGKGGSGRGGGRGRG